MKLNIGKAALERKNDRALAGLEHEIAHRGAIQSRLRLAVNSDHLLARRMRHSGEHARLGDGVAALDATDSAYRDVFLAKSVQQHAARLVIANYTYGQHSHAQVGQVVDGIP